MSHRRYSTSAALAASTAVVAAVASIGITGCGNDRVTADARRTLGPQLGASQSTSVAAAPQQRQAASADDLIAARRYLEATIRLDPTNEGARAALAGLGGPADADLAVPNVTPLAGPVASRAPGARPSASFGEVAFGAVGAIGSDVATAVSPLANGLATVRVGAVRSDSARSITAMVVGRSSSDSAAGDSTRLMRTANQPSNSGHAAATRRRGEYELETAVAARADSADAAAQNSGDSIHATTARSTGTVTKAKHKRTWPWTRAQRWLVAKGDRRRRRRGRRHRRDRRQRARRPHRGQPHGWRARLPQGHQDRPGGPLSLQGRQRRVRGEQAAPRWREVEARRDGYDRQGRGRPSLTQGAVTRGLTATR